WRPWGPSTFTTAPAEIPWARTTSVRKIHGWPRRTRASPRRLTTTGPSTTHPPWRGGFYTAAAEAVRVSSLDGLAELSEAEGLAGLSGAMGLATGGSRFTAPWNTAPSSITRRFATNVPFARAVGESRSDSARTSPSNSPSISTALALTIAFTRLAP